MGTDLLLHALRRSDCSHARGETGSAPAGRVQNLVPGVHAQQGQKVIGKEPSEGWELLWSSEIISGLVEIQKAHVSSGDDGCLRFILPA